MNLKTHLQSIIDSADSESLNMSLDNVHAKGIFSLVISGTEHGKLTRIFVAHKKLKPYKVQLHTHRYPLRLTIIKGDIIHHIAKLNDDGSVILPLNSYKSPLNGGKGISSMGFAICDIVDQYLPAGSVINLTEDDFHTMSCSKGSIWIVEEMGFRHDESYVIGVPFETPNNYTKPGQYQINNNITVAFDAIKKLINKL